MAGVCGGLAEAYGFDVITLRAVFGVLLLPGAYLDWCHISFYGLSCPTRRPTTSQIRTLPVIGPPWIRPALRHRSVYYQGLSQDPRRVLWEPDP